MSVQLRGFNRKCVLRSFGFRRPSQRNTPGRVFGSVLVRVLSTAHSNDLHSFAPDVLVKDYAYELPADRIAREPAARGESKLLVALPQEGLPQNSIARAARKLLRSHHRSKALDDYVDIRFDQILSVLPKDDVHLVFNESQVFAARLFARAHTGSEPVEAMFLSPETPVDDPAIALSAKCEGQVWRCMLRCVVAEGQELPLCGGGKEEGEPCPPRLQVEKVHSRWEEEGEGEGVEASVRLINTAAVGESAQQLFDRLGHVPLPPYMGRDARPEDTALYQTLYANEQSAGSVAAPTAGLHFSDSMLSDIERLGIQQSRIALHVSAGTFRPVGAEKIVNHNMHEERFSVSREALVGIIKSIEARRSVVPVGTTSSRCLESLYWLGVKLILRAGRRGQAAEEGFHIEQWEPYAIEKQLETENVPTASEALAQLLDEMDRQRRSQLRGQTSICIVPGYRFRLCDAIVTNFHQPDSTLMLLVGALLGGAKPIHAVYEHALQNAYRFLSYGDASLLFNSQGGEKKALGEAETITKTLSDLVRSSTKASGDMKVLLHSCCAPCSGAMIEEMHSHGLDVTIFFYNPNIHPRKEYEIRKDENKRYAEKLGIPFVDADYDADEWYKRAEGMEYDPERGRRCSMCFDMRFERTADYAAQHGFTHFTTTNATSRWKDQNQVNDSGARAAAAYDGLKYIESDWQTEEMNIRKYRINADEKFYKQEYCGCSFSLRDTNMYRKKEGLDPVVIGGGGVYSDPLGDAAEESPDVVDSFFRDLKSDESASWRRSRDIYRQRRKSQDAEKENNW